MKAAVAAPVPGRAPTPQPISELRASPPQRPRQAPRPASRMRTARTASVVASRAEARSSTSDSAKRPITTAIRSSPAVRSNTPNSKRGMPMMGSVPISARKRPMTPIRSPLTMLSVETAAMQVSAMTISAKTSIEPKRTATRASCGAAAISSAQERSPPSTEAEVAQPSASPARPARAMGKPSSVVAAACGVPGVLMRMAEIEPP